MSRLFTAICISVLIVTFTPSATRADPIEITSGFVSITGLVQGPVFNLVGMGFVATGGGGESGTTGPSFCLHCLPGDIIPINSSYSGRGLGTGTAILNGSLFTNIFFLGRFQFTGDPFMVPSTHSNVTLLAPFDFSGNLIGCRLFDPDCQAPVFSTELVGSGIARVELIAFLGAQGEPFFQFVRVTYVFGPIPEPASILLLTGGLAALGAAKFKHRRTGLKKKR